MSRWFRFHADSMRNPKVARLTDKQHRLWTNLMCVAAENEGRIPCLDDLKYLLNRRLDHLSTGVKELISAGLIDALADGYEPHNWSKHQFKSDTSTDRVAKHRAKGNVSVTPPETDTDTYIEDEIAKAIPSTRAKRASAGSRIPDDWLPSILPANVAELAAQWPPGRIDRELANFRDYWKSRSRDACKTDWDLTWHNRIRDIHERVLRDNRNVRPAFHDQQHTAPTGRPMGRSEAAARAVAARAQPAAAPQPAADSGRGGPPVAMLGLVRPLRDVG